ncbi:hypothetical protein IWQ61_000170 [Dispira simplex]|nr:hypothetical protein IWQ61_000170 [Dispira simplex]
MTTPIRPALSLEVFHALLDACLITAIRQLSSDDYESGRFLNADASPESYVAAFFAALTYYVDIGGSSFLNSAPGSYFTPSPTLTADSVDSTEAVPKPTDPTPPLVPSTHHILQPPVSGTPPRASSCGPYEPEQRKSLTNRSPSVTESNGRSVVVTTAAKRYRGHPLGIRRTSSHPVATRLEMDALASTDEAAEGSTLAQPLPGERMITWLSIVIDPSQRIYSSVVQQTDTAEPFVVYEIPVPSHIWANPDLPMHKYLQVSVNAVGQTGAISIPSVLNNQPSLLTPPTNDWVLAHLVNDLYPLSEDTELSDSYLLSTPSCIADGPKSGTTSLTSGNPIPYSLPEIQSKQSTVSFHLFPTLRVHAEFIQTWSPSHQFLALHIHNPITSVSSGRTYRIQRVDLACDDLVIEALAAPLQSSKNDQGLSSSAKNSNRVNLDIAVATGAFHSLVFKVRPKLPQCSVDPPAMVSSVNDQGSDSLRCLEVQISGTPKESNMSHVSSQQYKNTFQFNLTPCFPYFAMANNFVRVLPSELSNADDHPGMGTNVPGNSTEVHSAGVYPTLYYPEGLPHALPLRIILPSTHLAPTEFEEPSTRWSLASTPIHFGSAKSSLHRSASGITDDRTSTYHQPSMSASTAIKDHKSTYSRFLQPIPTRQHTVPVGWDHRTSLPPVPPGTARAGKIVKVMHDKIYHGPQTAIL